jgi:hypothetical protein
VIYMRGFVLFTNVTTLGVTLSVGANDTDGTNGYVLPDKGRRFGLTLPFAHCTRVDLILRFV